MSHNHSHEDATKSIKSAFFLNLLFTIIEIVGGILTNSLAIISDAVHDLGDSVSIGLAWYLQKKSQSGATSQFSYGLKRLSLVSAFINGVILTSGSIFIIYQAANRLLSPEQSNAQGMFWLSILGIVVNGFAVLRMKKGKTMNERVMTWHLLEDVIGWVAVLIASVILLFVEIPILDPLLSLGIALYILFNIYRNLKETIALFLQAVPQGLNIGDIEKSILTVPRVLSVHDTHIWSLDGQHNILTTHVVISANSNAQDAIDTKCLTKENIDKFDIEHSTIEVEFDNETCSVKH